MSPDVSAGVSHPRRNGKLQACEPCRHRKIRCDHGLPSCGRCVKRRQESKCYYHPAPLSHANRDGQPRGMPLDSRQSHVSLLSPSTATTSAVRSLNRVEAVVNVSPTSNLSSRKSKASEVGYLGSTSFSEVFKASEHVSDDIWLDTLAQIKHSLRTPASYRLSPERITSGARILGFISDYGTAKTTVETFYAVSVTVAIPWVTLDKAVDSIIKTLRDEYPTNTRRLSLVESIFANTGDPLELDENTTAEEFHEAFTGTHLRWEILGIFFTYLALGLHILEGDSNQQSEERQETIKKLVHASNTCVSFCDRVESLNDLLVWLLQGNTILLTMFYGDTNHLGWRRCGELASTIMAMGLHQDSSNISRLPYFIKELRKRAFANAYTTDKMISAFFGRPPRLPIRYCTCQPPYDLSDETILAASHVRELAISSLDGEGWSPGNANTIGRQGMARIKLALNIILEEVLDLSLIPPAADLEQSRKAQMILDKADATWKAIPDFAKYDDSCWDSDVASNDCFILLYFLLHIDYCRFLLYRVQARHGGCSWGQVHLVAFQLLSRVLDISKHRDRIRGVSREISWRTLLYGLPSAALLAIELLRQQQNSVPASSETPRSQTIRNLSVFISMLEWVARPNDGNYDLCQKARAMLEKILEAILDPQPPNAMQEVQQLPSDPLSWIDDVFNNGWMACGPFGDGNMYDDTLMYGGGMGWLLPV